MVAAIGVVTTADVGRLAKHHFERSAGVPGRSASL